MEKAYQLGKKLGERSAAVSPKDKAEAERALAWSKEQAAPAEENHRVAVEKG